MAVWYGACHVTKSMTFIKIIKIMLKKLIMFVVRVYKYLFLNFKFVYKIVVELLIYKVSWF